MNDKPKFLCARCSTVMCADCQQIAAEYEQLLGMRTIALMNADIEIKELKHQVNFLTRSVESWQHVALAGYPDVIQAYLKSETEKAIKKGRAEERRLWKKLGIDTTKLHKIINQNNPSGR